MRRRFTLCFILNPKEAILAARALNAQNFPYNYNLAPFELNSDSSRCDEGSTYDNDAEIPISSNLNDFDMLAYGNASLSTLDGFGSFEQPRSEELANMFGALIDCTPDTTN